MPGTTRRTMLEAAGAGGAAAVAGCTSTSDSKSTGGTTTRQTSTPTANSVAADPTDLPDPIDRDEPTHHDVTLTAKEVTAEIEPGVEFDFMTFDGQIPGPMLRVRRGDAVSFTLENTPENSAPHNVDRHAVYGTGGGAVATTAKPGEANAKTFRLEYPGAYIYHCAIPTLDYHISSGMFGMILVEPEDGLPDVDHEFYFGQHEVYTDAPAGKQGKHGFDFDAMKAEDPTYVLLNGEKFAWTADRHGPLEAETGDRVRVFFVAGGPNLPSHFHPIGNVWTEAYRDGALAGRPERFVQTMTVPPGSCMVGEMDCPVPSRVRLVDHALSRVARKGMMAEIDVVGAEEPDVFDPEPDGADEGPIYGDGEEPTGEPSPPEPVRGFSRSSLLSLRAGKKATRGPPPRSKVTYRLAG
jgi:nitrite reductase (NO-forming)